MVEAINRFSSRVENYVKYRPGYPADVIDLLANECGLRPASIIADIGSGTGILSELFLKNGNKVFGVEPNREMRDAAESLLRPYEDFISVNGRAEATTLAAHSVDFVTVGQAFHWFDQQKTRREFARILRSDGWVILIWNERRLNTSEFLVDFEKLLLKYGTDYQQIRHENVETDIASFFAPGSFKLAAFENLQQLNLEGLKGRVFSASYTPEPGHPDYVPMLNELSEIFYAHQIRSKVTVEYNTKLYFGQLTGHLEGSPENGSYFSAN